MVFREWRLSLHRPQSVLRDLEIWCHLRHLWIHFHHLWPCADISLDLEPSNASTLSSGKPTKTYLRLKEMPGSLRWTRALWRPHRATWCTMCRRYYTIKQEPNWIAIHLQDVAKEWWWQKTKQRGISIKGSWFSMTKVGSIFQPWNLSQFCFGNFCFMCFNIFIWWCVLTEKQEAERRCIK